MNSKYGTEWLSLKQCKFSSNCIWSLEFARNCTGNGVGTDSHFAAAKMSENAELFFSNAHSCTNEYRINSPSMFSAVFAEKHTHLIHTFAIFSREWRGSQLILFLHQRFEQNCAWYTQNIIDILWLIVMIAYSSSFEGILIGQSEENPLARVALNVNFLVFTLEIRLFYE